MAWHHVEDQTTRVPQYQKRSVALTKTGPSGIPYTAWVERSSKQPTGEVKEVVHSVWRCGLCRALAVGAQGIPPDGTCQKCPRGR